MAIKIIKTVSVSVSEAALAAFSWKSISSPDALTNQGVPKTHFVWDLDPHFGASRSVKTTGVPQLFDCEDGDQMNAIDIDEVEQVEFGTCSGSVMKMHRTGDKEFQGEISWDFSLKEVPNVLKALQDHGGVLVEEDALDPSEQEVHDLLLKKHQMDKLQDEIVNLRHELFKLNNPQLFTYDGDEEFVEVPDQD